MAALLRQLATALVLQPGSKLLFEEQREDTCDSVCSQQLIFASEGWGSGNGRGAGLRKGKGKGKEGEGKRKGKEKEERKGERGNERGKGKGENKGEREGWGVPHLLGVHTKTQHGSKRTCDL